ncbi:MAG: alpha/beta hydrolase [Roseibacillus sp.]|nr:alpha/beta hydrolase [Roseibacillus sp.]
MLKLIHIPFIASLLAANSPAVAEFQSACEEKKPEDSSSEPPRAKPLVQESSNPLTLSLWPNQKAPNGDGTFDNANATITVHNPPHPSGAAALICPGGGYGGVVIGPEGHGIAKWLNKHGITGIVLHYRLPRGRSSVPLLDAQRALRIVRARGAQEWHCDPKRLGVIGFSAGGHLASTVATHFDEGNPGAASPIDRQSSRPDFAILVYPVITMGAKTHGGSRRNLLGAAPSAELIALYSNEKQVTSKTCPCYLAHAKDDRPVPPENSRLFHAALQSSKVPSEYLELPSGGHGLNGYKGPMGDAWQQGSLVWLRKMKIISATQ